MKNSLSLSDLILLGIGGIVDIIQELKDPGGLFSSYYQNTFGYIPARFKKPQLAKTIYRLIKEKNLKKTVAKKTSIFTLTKIGYQKLKRKFPHLFLTTKRWSNSLHLIVFDIKEKDRNKRDFLRYRLKEYGYYQLQKSVWVSFHPFPDKIKRIIKESEVGDQVIFLKTNSLETKNIQELIGKIFNLKKLTAKYQKLLDNLKNLKSNSILKTYSDRKHFWEKLKNEIITLFASTPSLPKKFLPKDLKEKMDQLKLMVKNISKTILK